LQLVNREREPAAREALEKLQAMGARRLRGEPITRILGEKEFYGLTFKVNAGTLIPRPETEMLVLKALQILESRGGKRRILDLGTGTGCIAISILTEAPTATAVATDINSEAVMAAQANAETHGVARRLDVRLGSWFEPLEPGDKFDVIVSNPPYIPHAVIETLAPEVKDHDPREALDGGPDGLEAYRAIVAEARRWLKSQGVLIVEIGSEQMVAVKSLFLQAGFRDVVFEKDLAGLDRMLVGYHS
ncbi:MAG TPA: peptide chain release factor N(5)-glutamine methyltransferase, partial [Alphaproteobacteria bacterium]|nr:peptide chain release factor N(5)-glutamine methyltransferase [Alphaproteobacteria bacterium]